jgi:hypothetical protein
VVTDRTREMRDKLKLNVLFVVFTSFQNIFVNIIHTYCIY